MEDFDENGIYLSTKEVFNFCTKQIKLLEQFFNINSDPDIDINKDFNFGKRKKAFSIAANG